MAAKVLHISKFDLDSLPAGEISRLKIHIISDGIGNPIYVPVMVAKGVTEGPTLCLTAALHGNELNGIPVIQEVFRMIDPTKLSGTIIGVVALNVPGILLGRREFNDNFDLNHLMPGVRGGNQSQIFAHRVFSKIVRRATHLIDLHTASFGRVNSYYVRADMDNLISRDMALLQGAEIILHNDGASKTLRHAAANIGIHAITVELRDPHVIQRKIVQESVQGICATLSYLKMYEGGCQVSSRPPVICSTSSWVYTDAGGILEVVCKVGEKISYGQKIARVLNIFGDVIREYTAPYEGIVIGRSVNPINQTGSRIIHLGKIGES